MTEREAKIEVFNAVLDDLEAGNPLTYAHIAKVFGEQVWIMLIETLLDAQDAARAIQAAGIRLRHPEMKEDV